MKTSFTCGGIKFTMNGRVFVKEYFQFFYMTFNAGSLAGVDTIEYNITPYNSSDGAAFQELKLTEAYADIKVEFGEYFNSLYSATGRYILSLRLSKNNIVVDGYNHQFYFCKYANYQMGITVPNQVRSIFRPAVFSYSQAGLHVDTETAVAKYIEFEIGDYVERRKVHNGTASADVSEYLRQIFKDIDPWKFEAVNQYYNFISDNQLYKYYSVVIKLIDGSGKLIGVSEYNMDCLYAVGAYFDNYNVFNYAGKWRKRMIFWNMPFTFDVFLMPGNSTDNWYGSDIGFTYKKMIYNPDKDSYTGGAFVNLFNVELRGAQVDLKKLIDYHNSVSVSKIDFEIVMKHGIYICSANGIDSELQSTDKIGIDCEINSATCGVYIRWISRFGEHCYWLFKEGTTTIEAKKSSEFKRLDTSFNEKNIRNIETSKIIKIGDAVKDDYLDFLSSLADGWAVQMYNSSDGTWQNVVIQDAKVACGNSAAGNMVEFEVEIPQLNIRF